MPYTSTIFYSSHVLNCGSPVTLEPAVTSAESIRQGHGRSREIARLKHHLLLYLCIACNKYEANRGFTWENKQKIQVFAIVSPELDGVARGIL